MIIRVYEYVVKSTCHHPYQIDKNLVTQYLYLYLFIVLDQVTNLQFYETVLRVLTIQRSLNKSMGLTVLRRCIPSFFYTVTYSFSKWRLLCSMRPRTINAREDSGLVLTRTTNHSQSRLVPVDQFTVNISDNSQILFYYVERGVIVIGTPGTRRM